MKEKLISVIVPYSPTHTPQEMLDEALASVDAQSVPTESIVVTDEEGRGPSWARNRGMERSDARFVALLDADDLWKPRKLERQLEAIEDTGAAICVEGASRSTEAFLRDLYIGRISSLTSSVLLDTSAVEPRFVEELERREDHFFILEAAAAGGVCFCDDIVTIRKQPNGLSARGSPELRLRANERFAELFAERISPELADRYADAFYHKLYHGIGRAAHHGGQYGQAIGYFRRALAHAVTPLTLAAMCLSIIGYFSKAISEK